MDEKIRNIYLRLQMLHSKPCRSLIWMVTRWRRVNDFTQCGHLKIRPRLRFGSSGSRILRGRPRFRFGCDSKFCRLESL